MKGAPETDAQLDLVIDSLLTGGDAIVAGGELATTARLLHETLPRFHPSFSFEEHLARRLTASRSGSSPATVTAPPTPIRPVVVPDTRQTAGSSTPSERRRRGLVAGGAIASGVSLAIPIAGAAFVMWRRSRSSGGLS